MSPIVIILLLILMFGSGYRFYGGSPYGMAGAGIVGVILLVIIVLALMGRI
jgi:hypothetical protein